MRLSVIPNDPGYDMRRAIKASAFLDGEKLSGCVTADEDMGYVDVFKLESNGNISINKTERKAITIRRYGEVIIII